MGQYENDHKLYPQRIIMDTESVPIHAFENWQLVEKHPYVIGDFEASGNGLKPAKIIIPVKAKVKKRALTRCSFIYLFIALRYSEDLYPYCN